MLTVGSVGLRSAAAVGWRSSSRALAGPAEGLRGYAEEVAPGVFSFEMLSASYCDRLLAELEGQQRGLSRRVRALLMPASHLARALAGLQ